MTSTPKFIDSPPLPGSFVWMQLRSEQSERAPGATVFCLFVNLRQYDTYATAGSHMLC